MAWHTSSPQSTDVGMQSLAQQHFPISSAWPSYIEYQRNRDPTFRSEDLHEPIAELAMDSLIWVSIKRYSSHGILEQRGSVKLIVGIEDPPRELHDLLLEVTGDVHQDSVHLVMITVASPQRFNQAARNLVLNYLGCHLDLPKEKITELFRGSNYDYNPGVLLDDDLFYLYEHSMVCSVVQCSKAGGQLGMPRYPLRRIHVDGK